MRKKVIALELEQLKRLCIEEYGIENESPEELKKLPEITLIIVNKRIR